MQHGVHINRAELLINTGLDAFNMQVGGLSRIHDDMYIVKASNSRDHQARHFALNTTLCYLVIQENKVLTTNHIQETFWLDHTIDPLFQFAACIIAPVWVDDALYGTVFFGSYEARPTAFSPQEESYIAMLSMGFSTVIKQGLSLLE